MQSDQIALANGRPRSPASGFEDADLAGLRATCRRQARAIETLGHAVSTLHRGALALKAENAELRAANERLSGQERLRIRAEARMDDGELANVVIPLGVQAPGVARSVVARCLAEYVGPSMLETMQLLVSELVTNSVRHSGVPEGEDIVVRVHVWRGMCRLEVEDPGHEGAIAPQPPDPVGGAGMGLNLLVQLSECWGVVRGAHGPTRVWAQIRSPVLA